MPRALPDLVSRLRIDASDLAQVPRQAEQMERGIKASAQAAGAALQGVERSASSLQTTAGRAVIKFGEDGRVTLDRLSSTSAKTRVELDKLTARATVFGQTMSREFQRGTSAVVQLDKDGTASLQRVTRATAGASAEGERAGGVFTRFRTSLGGAVGASVGAAGPLAAVGLAVGGVYTAVDKVIAPAASFEQQMVKLVGTAGESDTAIKAVSAGVLQMAGDVGYGASELADGLYLVESAGYHGQNGLNVLRQSAMAAKAENADLATVANAVTTALNAYGLQAADASHVTDILLTATSQGKMTFQDLAGSLDQVLPVASAAKIGLNEVAAAIATQTAQGTPAVVAATNLAYAIKGLEVPSSSAAGVIESLGLKTDHFANELQQKGLLKTLDDLSTQVGKKFPQGSADYNAAISQILGNQEGLNAVLQLSGTHTKTFSDNLDGMGASAGKTQSSFREMMDTTGGKWSSFTSKLGADAIGLGTQALPVVNMALDKLSSALTSPELQSAWNAVSSSIVGGINIVKPFLAELEADFEKKFGPLLLYIRDNAHELEPALYAVGIVIGVVAAAFIVAGAIIVGAVAGIIWIFGEAHREWNELSKEWQATTVDRGRDFSNLGSWVHGATLSIGGDFSWLGSQAHGLSDAFGSAFSSLGSHVHNGFDAVRGVIQSFDRMVDSLPVIKELIHLPTDIPEFARGGFTQGPSIAGEAGYPEAVIPLGAGAGPRSMELWRRTGQMLGVEGLGGGFDVGTIGGQCLQWVGDVTGGFGRGVMAAIDLCGLASDGQPAGTVGISAIPPYGHAWINLPGGKVIDSNWVAPLTIGIHNLSDIPALCGSIPIGPVRGLPAAAGLDIGAELKREIAGAIGGLGGWEGRVASGLLERAVAGLARRFDNGGVWHGGLGLNSSGRDEYVFTEDQMARGGRAEGLLAEVRDLHAQSVRLLASIAGAPRLNGRMAAMRYG
jgi:TP901 family phage tail tape measure protein